MAGFIEEADRGQLSLLPGSLDDWVDKDNPVRVIDAFVEGLDLKQLGFETVEPLERALDPYDAWITGVLLVGIAIEGQRCHRRLEVQSGEQSRQELY